MLRIARRTQARLRYAFTDAEGEPAADLDAVAVTILDAADEVIVAGAGVPVAGEDGVFIYTFASPQTDDLGPLRVEWLATIDGAAQTFESWHEVVGSHIVTVADLRRHEGLGADELNDDGAQKYPTWLLEKARDTATYALEDACHTAFVRRRRTDRASDARRLSRIALQRARDVSIAAGTADARVLAAQELSGLRVERGGLVTADYNVPAQFGHDATITYDYGWNAPPPRVALAVEKIAAEWARDNADDLAVPARATMIDSDAGNIRLVTAGEFGRYFDIPEANAVVKMYAE